MTSKKIGIVCSFPFPFGYSGTNRILAYAKGLISQGCDVTVFIDRKTEKADSVVNKNSSGIYDRVKFEYPSNDTIKSNYKLFIAIDILIDLVRTLGKITVLKPEILIISNDNPYWVFCYSLYGKILKIKKIVLIVDEFPKPIRYGGQKIPIWHEFLFRLSFKNINRFISITKIIAEYYNELAKQNLSHLLVPILVENDRFSQGVNKRENFITYVGNLEIEKDGVDILIKSFSQLINLFPNYKLLLLGDGKDKNTLVSLAKELSIFEKIIFKGKVSRDEVPGYICRSKVLCLSRPNSKRAEGGFPTKLGEYLASGVPVVVTDVGEISLYLEDNNNAYVARASDISDFTKKIISVLNDYDKAIEIGKNGKALALKEFDNFYQSERMLRYFEELS